MTKTITLSGLLLFIVAGLLLVPLASHTGKAVSGAVSEMSIVGRSPTVGVEKPYTVELPLSNHAKKSHANEAWNATTIQEFFLSGKCKPRMYACPNKNQEVHYCQIKKNLEIGILVGLEGFKQIITGYAQPAGQWGGMCR